MIFLLNLFHLENLIVLDNFDDGVELKFDNIDSKLYLTKID